MKGLLAQPTDTDTYKLAETQMFPIRELGVVMGGVGISDSVTACADEHDAGQQVMELHVLDSGRRTCIYIGSCPHA